MADFVYYDGSHRFVGWGLFPVWVERPEGLSPYGKPMSPPRAIYAPDPVYPKEARKKGVQGTVVVSCLLGTDGKPRDLKVVSGDPALQLAALDAVGKWRFSPYLLDGKATETTITVQVNFRTY